MRNRLAQPRRRNRRKKHQERQQIPDPLQEGRCPPTMCTDEPCDQCRREKKRESQQVSRLTLCRRRDRRRNGMNQQGKRRDREPRQGEKCHPRTHTERLCDPSPPERKPGSQRTRGPTRPRRRRQRNRRRRRKNPRSSYEDLLCCQKSKKHSSPTKANRRQARISDHPPPRRRKPPLDPRTTLGRPASQHRRLAAPQNQEGPRSMKGRSDCGKSGENQPRGGTMGWTSRR